MSWADFYLICFALGFAFSLLSFVLGGLHGHLPHGFGSPHAHLGPHVPAGHGASPVAGGHGAKTAGSGISWLNPPTLAAFLAWFGGAGYLLTRFSAFWFLLSLGVAVLSGVTGGGIVFVFMTRVLVSEDENLDPAEFEMIGVLGRTSMPIRAGGTGELIYSQAGTRRTCGARAEDGTAIGKGTEVVVTRYEKGIAYVKLWSELAGEATDSLTAEKSPERENPT
jgi:membrane protein implicated in regulation of membrane protease activity